MIRKLFGAVIAALAVVPAVSAAEACADSMVCTLNTLWLVAPAASVIALIVAVIFYKKMIEACNVALEKSKEE